MPASDGGGVELGGGGLGKHAGKKASATRPASVVDLAAAAGWGSIYRIVPPAAREIKRSSEA
jgi:hypothetical protein